MLRFDRMDRVPKPARGRAVGKTPQAAHGVVARDAEVPAANKDRAAFGLHHPEDGIETDVGWYDHLGIDACACQEVKVLPQNRFGKHQAERRRFFSFFRISVSERYVVQNHVLQGKGHHVLDLEGERLFNALAVGKGKRHRALGKKVPGDGGYDLCAGPVQGLRLQDLDKLRVRGKGL